MIFLGLEIYDENTIEELIDYIEHNKADLQDVAGELLVDYDTYRAAAENRGVAAVVLRQENKIVGFSVFYLSADLRDKRIIEAENHGLYIEKQHRRRFGSAMLERTGEFFSSIGVNKISFRNDSAAFGRLMSRFGYKPTMQIWSLENGK